MGPDREEVVLTAFAKAVAGYHREARQEHGRAEGVEGAALEAELLADEVGQLVVVPEVVPADLAVGGEVTFLQAALLYMNDA